MKFNILDENKNILYENKITNENGEIVLEKMLPGKYYISEIETLDGYNLYTDLIEINLDFNEEFEVVVNNTIKDKTEINKQFENVEVTSKSTETVYNVENKSSEINKENIENKTTLKNNIKKLPITGF